MPLGSLSKALPLTPIMLAVARDAPYPMPLAAPKHSPKPMRSAAKDCGNPPARARPTPPSASEAPAAAALARARPGAVPRPSSWRMSPSPGRTARTAPRGPCQWPPAAGPGTPTKCTGCARARVRARACACVCVRARAAPCELAAISGQHSRCASARPLISRALPRPPTLPLVTLERARTRRRAAAPSERDVQDDRAETAHSGAAIDAANDVMGSSGSASTMAAPAAAARAATLRGAGARARSARLPADRRRSPSRPDARARARAPAAIAAIAALRSRRRRRRRELGAASPRAPPARACAPIPRRVALRPALTPARIRAHSQSTPSVQPTPHPHALTRPLAHPHPHAARARTRGGWLRARSHTAAAAQGIKSILQPTHPSVNQIRRKHSQRINQSIDQSISQSVSQSGSPAHGIWICVPRFNRSLASRPRAPAAPSRPPADPVASRAAPAADRRLSRACRTSSGQAGPRSAAPVSPSFSRPGLIPASFAVLFGIGWGMLVGWFGLVGWGL